MTIKENPFYILEASVHDNKQKIMSLAEEKSLEIDESVCTEARIALTNPRKRLSAEMSWFPGVGEKATKAMLGRIKFGLMEKEDMKNLPPLVAFNLSVNSLSSTKLSDSKLEQELFDIAVLYSKINPNTLLNAINEDRAVSGFPEITDTSSILEELDIIRTQSMQTIEGILNKRPLQAQNKIMLSILNKEQKHSGALDLVQDYIEKIYAMSVQKEMGELKSGLMDHIEKIKTTAKRKNVTVSQVGTLVDKFLIDLTEFDTIMQPMQVSTQNRGLEHSDSREMARETRSLAIYLSNTLDDLSLSEKIVRVGKKLFAEVGSADQAFQEDIDTLFRIKENQKEHDASITCTVHNSYSWDNRALSISPKGVTYGNTKIKLEDITWIRYGTTIKLNTWTTDVDTYVGLGDDENVLRITWLTEKDFKTFTTCLWKAVGPRIIMNMVDQLALGNSLYGIIYDNKVKLAKQDDWGPTEIKFFKLSDIRVGVAAGHMIISAKSDPKFKVDLSFQDADNVQALYLLLDAFLSRGGNSISKAFDVTPQDAKKRKQVDFSTPIELESYMFIWNWIKAIFWSVFIGGILLLAMFAD